MLGCLSVALLLSLAPAEPAWVELGAGLRYQLLRPGREADRPTPGDTVRVHYVGTLADGTKFDSSRDRQEPFEFILGAGQVIRGWDTGVRAMAPESVIKLHVPAALGYGAAGHGRIPPHAELFFEIELLQVVDGPLIPDFRPLDPARTITCPSGLKYEVEAAGEGDGPTAADGVSLRWVLWSGEGEVLGCTAATEILISGALDELQLGPWPQKFLPEAARLLHPGGGLRLEVPAELCWGDRQAHPALPAGAPTFWYLELATINAIPEFAPTPAEKLQRLPSGLGYEVLRAGEGEAPGATDTVEVRYTGWLTDGTRFDSSHARGETAVFRLDEVIPGWSEGVRQMRPGAVYRLTLPPALAYGDDPPRGSGIPAGATLIFLVELVGVSH